MRVETFNRDGGTLKRRPSRLTRHAYLDEMYGGMLDAGADTIGNSEGRHLERLAPGVFIDTSYGDKQRPPLVLRG